MENFILVAVVGESPAILTETVWALAQEEPPVIPEEVVAITTLTGKSKINEMLFGDDAVWEELRCTFGKAAEGKLRFGAEDTIKVIGDGLESYADIATPRQNEQAADFILRSLRQYTEDPSTTVIASIAGGRKTMSALMLACMSLLGREQDRVCHVLADETFLRDHRDFCFPKNKREEKAAAIQLSDIPFIRVRGWYEQESGKAPASYSHMVSLFRKSAPAAIVYPHVRIDYMEGIIQVDGEPIRTSPLEFLLILTLAERFLIPARSYASWDDVQCEVDEIMQEEHPFGCGWHEKVLGTEYRTKRWSAVASELRSKKLNGRPFARNLVPGPGDHIDYPPEKLEIIGRQQTSE